MASPANPAIPALPRQPTTAHAYTLPILSLLGILILIVPFIYHLRARNTGACALIFYLCVFNLIVFINVLIWPDNNFSDWWSGEVLCDIEVKITWPITVGVASSTLAITRSLAMVLDVDNANLNPSRGQKRRKVLVDLAICFAVPLLIVGLHHIVHRRRYIIVAIGGCTDSYHNSWPTVVIIWIWPLVFTLINVYYAGLVISRLHRHRSSISSILSSHSLNTSRFLRLFIMSLLLLLIYLPLNIFWFYANISQSLPLEPYSWAAAHDAATWNVIPYLPAIGVFTFDRYVPAAMALFVFAFFGTGTEARRIYAGIATACGLAKCFPRLKQERRPSKDVGEGGWLERLSLVAVGKRYFAKLSSRGGSRDATEMTSTTTNTSSTHKPSTTALENAPSFTFQTSSQTSTHNSVSPPTSNPFPPHHPSFFSRLLASLHLSSSSSSSSRKSGNVGTTTATSVETAVGGMDMEDHDLVNPGSRTHVWSPRGLVGGEEGSGVGMGGAGGRFERLGSVGSEGTEGVGEGEVKVRTKVGVRVESV